MHIIDPLTGILVILLGVFIGVVSGMLGIGGGTMIVPLFNLFFGLPMINATATSLLCIAPTALSGSLKHIRQKTAHLKVGLIIGFSGAVASVIGSLISSAIPALLVVIITVVIILFSSIRMLLEGRKKPDSEEESVSFQEREAKISKKGLPFACGLGLFAGLLAGIVGVGGGFIIVPFCIAYLGFKMKEAAGTSLIAIGIIAIPGIVTHAFLGQIEWLYGIALIIGAVPGAQVGAWLVNKLPDRPMRIAFGILLVIIGGMLLFNNVRM